MTDKISITVEINGADQSVRILDQLGNEVKKVDKAAESTQGSFSRFQAGIIALNQSLDLARRAFSIVSGAANQLGSALQDAQRFQGLEQAFTNLQGGSAAAATKLQELREATLGLVADTELLQSANQAVLLGLPTEELDELAAVATKLGQATGRTATEAFNDLITGLGRGSRLILDNLGIIVDSDQAYRDFAESIGVTVDQLSDLGKQEAFRQAGIQQAIQKSSQLNDITIDASAAYVQLTKAAENAYKEFVTGIGASEDLGKAMSNLSELVAAVDWKAFGDALASLINVVVEPAIKFIDDLADKLSSLADVTDLIQRADARAKQGFGPITSLLLGTYDQRGVKAVQDLKTILQSYKKDVDEVGQETKKTDAIQKDWLKTQEDLADGVAKSTKVIKDDFKDAFDFIKSEMGGLTTDGNLIEFTFDTESAQESASRFADVLQDSLIDGIGRGLSRAINGETLKTDDYGDIVGGIGGSIADSFLPGSGQVVDALVGSLFSAFDSEDAGTTARKSADKFFADVFDANRLQVIIDGQLQEINDLVFKGDTLFGGNSDFADGSFSQFLQSLPGEAQQAFNGVGTAFEQLLGVGEDIAGQLGSVFANNIGGDLNNLQLLVQATGKSFEEMKDAVVDAFLNGQLGAIETQSALAGLQEIFTDGIPGAIGATDKAFANLVAAGPKGGRALVDALQDIGFEAEELGLDTLPQVQEQLLATGQFSAEQIQQVFDALAASGINSVEQLTSATIEGLLPALAQLEAQNFFPDLSENISQVDNLIQKVDSLPDRIEKRLVFNVESRIDSNTQQLASAGAFSAAGVPTPGLNQ